MSDMHVCDVRISWYTAYVHVYDVVSVHCIYVVGIWWDPRLSDIELGRKCEIIR